MQHLAHPSAAQLGVPFFTPKAQIAEALFYILFVVLTAVLFAKRDSFHASRAALTTVLLVVSIGLLTTAVYHVTQVQKQRAAAGQIQKQSPPSSAPASSNTMQELQTIGGEALSFGRRPADHLHHVPY